MTPKGLRPRQSTALSPRVVAWEVTRACPLSCLHCRAESQREPDPAQLSTDEGKALLADVAAMGGPTVVILTGGEPLVRPDVFELAEYGARLGLHVAVSPDDGRLLTPKRVARLRASGVARVSFSLHYPDALENDLFARTPGAFAAALKGLANLRDGDLPFQVNTTVTSRNVDLLPRLYELVSGLGPVAWDLFFLVPTGRASALESLEMPPERYERALGWLHDLRPRASFPVKQTCAPHYRRVERQRAAAEGPIARGGQAETRLFGPSDRSWRHGASSRGCMCGNGFAFVSHVGVVQGCGYLPVPAGSVRKRPFGEIYRTSPLLADLRDEGKLGGKCGRCEYRQFCGGCRARAYAASGDYLAEEPYCVYEPR